MTATRKTLPPASAQTQNPPAPEPAQDRPDDLTTDRVTDRSTGRDTDRRPGADDTKASRGTAREPRLPHERDESADSQQGSHPPNDEPGRQGHADLKRGLVDTDQALRADHVGEGADPPPVDPGH
jgi:hypothetical protein